MYVNVPLVAAPGATATSVKPLWPGVRTHRATRASPEPPVSDAVQFTAIGPPDVPGAVAEDVGATSSVHFPFAPAATIAAIWGPVSALRNQSGSSITPVNATSGSGFDVPPRMPPPIVTGSASLSMFEIEPVTPALTSV